MKKTYPCKHLLTGALISLLCLPSQAATPPQNHDIAEQEPLVVTANRWPQKPDTVIPSLTVITRADIERLLAIDIMDVLALVPGIDVVRTGPAGSATSVFVRGANSNHVLVLIDGVRVASGNTGAFAWEHLPAAQIERIEILRGPRASLYGSDAIGGVIQIFTREHHGADISLGTGSYDTVEATLGYGQNYAQGRGHVSAQLGGRGSEGFSAVNSGHWAYDPDKDGYANLNANLKARWQADWGTARLSYLETRGDIDFDPANNNSDSAHRTLGAAIQIDGDNWRHEVLLGANQQDLYTKAYHSRFKSERLSADWLLHGAIGGNQALSMGLSWYQDLGQVGVDAPYHLMRTDQAAFVNWSMQFARQRLEAAVRYDDFSDAGAQTTGNLGWQMQLTPDWRVGIDAGKAFQSPAFNDLFYAMLGSDGSHSPLLPEKSLAGEINVQHRVSPHADWQASIFKQKITDLIQYVPTDPDDPFSLYTPRNIGQAEILGIELDGRWQRENWLVRANATIQDTLDKGADTPLLRRPDRKGSVQVDRQWSKLSVGATVFGSSGRTDFNGPLAGFTTVDVRLHYRIHPQWRLGIKVHNLADRDHQLASGYNTPGRSFWVQLQWQQAR